jgi:Werner syndrome ATP-dependent helicase
LTKEVAIVISPLIALMADQKMILDNLGMTSCCYNSTMSDKKKYEIEKGLVDGKFQILYITPESLDNCHYLIEQIYEKQGICMIAIDEAHCLSSYGFDFRPKYKNIVKLRKILTNVPVLAVTATATDKVIQDIKTLMKMDKCELIKTSFDRPNLNINVRMQTQDTVRNIIDIIEESDGPAIVYCLKKDDTEMMAKKLSGGGIETKAYHAGLKKEERTEIQEGFMKGEYPCITATIAFGMGINKADVRTVIHYGCPQNIESYYQEIGRAGRDGKDSKCYLFYKQNDFRIHEFFIDKIADSTYKNVRKIMLCQISEYVNASDCRRKYILKYFGQIMDTKTCNNCDNCTRVKKSISKKDEHMLFQILSTVLTIKEEKGYTFGLNTIVLILKGSASQKIKPWMKQLPYYGSLKHKTPKDVASFIQKGIEYGYLEDHDVGGCVRVLQCTDQGIAFGAEYEEKLKDMVDAEDSDIEKILLED